MIRLLFWLGTLTCLGSLMFVPIAASAAQDTVANTMIVHVEVPEYPPLARLARVTGPVCVRVSIDAAGAVVSTTVESGHALLRRNAEAAARLWVFSPSVMGGPRELKLIFVFAGVRETESDGGIDVSFDDPFTIRLVYVLSTVEWLTRENGEIPERRCSVHGEVMDTEVVDIHYGLARSYINDGSREARRLMAGIKAYWKAKEMLFPETNRWVGGGCIVETTKRAEVYYCRSCRNAEEAWLQAHPAVHPNE